MDIISNINESNGYATPKPAPVDDTQLKNQNREAAQTDLSQESVRAVRDAFDVRITQEARDRQAAEKTLLAPAQETPEETTAGPGQSPFQSRGASQIINIVV